MMTSTMDGLTQDAAGAPESGFSGSLFAECCLKARVTEELRVKLKIEAAR
jgi:hypothetical protein